MSIIKEYFYNVKCDRCGKLANEELWKCDEQSAKVDADESSFVELGGKHYCPDCYTIDDDDCVAIKEVRK